MLAQAWGGGQKESRNETCSSVLFRRKVCPGNLGRLYLNFRAFACLQKSSGNISLLQTICWVFPRFVLCQTRSFMFSVFDHCLSLFFATQTIVPNVVYMSPIGTSVFQNHHQSNITRATWLFWSHSGLEWRRGFDERRQSPKWIPPSTDRR